MTWLQFKDGVKEFLTVDRDRLGAGTFIDKMLRQGVIDVQYFIPFYQKEHETTYTLNDVTDDGSASVGTLPEGSKPTDAFCVNEGDQCDRKYFQQYPWEGRFDLICGQLPCNPCAAACYMAIDPKGRVFYAYPRLTAGWKIQLLWDGIKLDFVDADAVPFDEPMEMAVGEFVSAKISRRVDKDLALYDSYWKSFALKRQQLYVDSNDRTRLSVLRTKSIMNCIQTCAPCSANVIQEIVERLVRQQLKFLGVFDTLADLMAFTQYADGGFAVMTGELSKDDGNGHTYIYRASETQAHNPFLIVKPTNIDAANTGRFVEYV